MLCYGIVIITIILIIASILFFPTIKISHFRLGTYWIIAVIAALLLILFRCVSWENIIESFTSDTSMNPLKILIPFITMTILSIFLDEVGFFHFIACKSTKLFKTSQIKLFFGFYALISLLTIFTSNDIIILTFTPFICYYTKNTKINPIPYLVSEFVAANTWSMLLIIGNPTNIYLASAFQLDFITYLSHMILPTLGASMVSLFLLWIIFRRKLKEPLSPFDAKTERPNLFLVVLGLVHLIVTTLLLAISSYIHLEMWIITLSFSCSLLLISFVYAWIGKKKKNFLIKTFIRAPWNLIPFILSMFIVVLSLNQQGFTQKLQNFLEQFPVIYSYGIGGAVVANLINNIPMSVLFSHVTSSSVVATYATIIASNIAAFMTPIGALAGIMWMSLLKTYDIPYRFKNFVLYGMGIGIPTILVSLSFLYIF